MIYLTLFSVIILTALLFFASKGIPRDIVGIERPIEDLLKRGFDGGTLVITHKKSKNFVQFRKYAKGKEQGIVFTFPLASWSEEYYSSIKKLAASSGIGGIEENLGMRFFEIDFGEDSLSSYSFTKQVFLRVFEATEDDKYYISLKGASSK